MHPRWFFDEVVTPNIHALEENADDMRAVVNAVLTLDALVGLLYAHLKALGRPEVAGLEDRDYREALSRECPGYAVLRDAAAALKHGELTHPRRGSPARLIRTPERIQSTHLVVDLLGCDDEVDGHTAILCLEGGAEAVRVDDAITAACRMLLPRLDTLAEPQTAVLR